MCACELSMWGDIANIVIAVASVATSIVTARMLIKQHNVQKEQHRLDQFKHDLELQKFEAQKQEHQPIFHFRRLDDCLEIVIAEKNLLNQLSLVFHQWHTYIFRFFILAEL